MLPLNIEVRLDNIYRSRLDTDRLRLLGLVCKELFLMPYIKDASDKRLRFVLLLLPHLRKMLIVEFELFHADPIDVFTKDKVTSEVFLN